ncbi:hypothetical protein D3C81_1194590 [compost metagenome]
MLVGLTQLGAQQRCVFQAHPEPTAYQQGVQHLHIELGQWRVDRQGDAQVAHDLCSITHHLYMEQRRGAHQVGGDQGVHGSSEGHHGEVLAQHEGNALARDRRRGTACGFQVG